jgi:hypothetical protein
MTARMPGARHRLRHPHAPPGVAPGRVGYDGGEPVRFQGPRRFGPPPAARTGTLKAHPHRPLDPKESLMPHLFYRAMYPFALALLLGLALSAQPATAAPDFLVDADWLGEHLKDDGLIVLEVRYHPHRDYTVGHIPGAVQVQRFMDLGNNQASPIMRFPSRETFQETLRGWGVNDDSTLVLYDDSSTALSARLYYLTINHISAGRLKRPGLNTGRRSW